MNMYGDISKSDRARTHAATTHTHAEGAARATPVSAESLRMRIETCGTDWDLVRKAVCSASGRLARNFYRSLPRDVREGIERELSRLPAGVRC